MSAFVPRFVKSPSSGVPADLTDGGDTTLHYHASDRNRANHTGTQTASTISDFTATARSALSDVEMLTWMGL